MSQTPDFILGDEFAKVLTETTMSLVCVLDQDGRILFFNDACEQGTGFTRDEEAFGGDPEAKLAEVGRLAQEQRALRRVATLVASEASPERVFTAVSEECARVLEVNASAVFRFEGDDTATIVGRHSREGAGDDAFKLGMRLPA